MKFVSLLLVVLIGFSPVYAQSVDPTPAPRVSEGMTDDLILPKLEQSVSGLSPIELFLLADNIVKGVMISLLFASVLSWTIACNKFFQLSWIRRKDRKVTMVIEKEGFSGLSRIDKKLHGAPVLDLAQAIIQTWQKSDRARAVTQCERMLNIQIEKRINALSSSIGFLASLGSTAPFVGLFGTVWGVMNAFRAIAVTKETSLDVVAPGIAEALLATAIGLFAAIPAVIFYNVLQGRIEKVEQRLSLFSAELVMKLESASTSK